MEENEIGKIVVDTAVEVHSALGPGLLESVYEAVLAKEFELRGLSLARQVPVPIEYEGMKFDEGFRADIIIEGKVILELKLRELKPGNLLNFGASWMKDGINRMINGIDDERLGVFGSLRETQREGRTRGFWSTSLTRRARLHSFVKKGALTL
tara:strand:- start:982 stop:1440 length:459 start_codon:yes stop_codon:yes gene_type:complete